MISFLPFYVGQLTCLFQEIDQLNPFRCPQHYHTVTGQAKDKQGTIISSEDTLIRGTFVHFQRGISASVPASCRFLQNLHTNLCMRNDQKLFPRYAQRPPHGGGVGSFVTVATLRYEKVKDARIP